MSVITEALKAAQREKSRRESETGGKPVAPVLVRLRTPPRDAARRSYVMVAAGIAVAAAVVTLWAMFSASDPLPNIPPVASTMLSEALAADSAKTNASSAPPRNTVTIPPAEPIAVRQGAATTGAAAPVPAAPRGIAAAGERMTTATPPAGGARAATLIPQGDSAPAAPLARQAGALRIAVEEPRGADASRLFNEAIAAHRAGDLARARSLYERVIALAPDDGDALNNLGVLYSGERDFERALALLRRAVTVAPANAGAWNNIGSALREQGLAQEAIGAYRQAIAVDPKHQGARVGLAQQYVALRDLPQARLLLEEALALNPRLAEAHYTLGQVLETQGDRSGAIAAYSAFIRFAPTRLSSHVELVRRRVDALAGAGG